MVAKYEATTHLVSINTGHLDMTRSQSTVFVDKRAKRGWNTQDVYGLGERCVRRMIN